MKKIYLAAALLASSLINAQSPYSWTPTTYKGAFPVTDGNTGINSNDWTAGWTNWDCENTVYPAPTMTVTGDINSNTTWTTGSVVYLNGFVHVINNAELTIQPGVIIRGKQTDATLTPGILCISPGSKIHANGTASAPIVFTSIQSPGNRAAHDWGGLMILGKAPVNLHTTTLAAFTPTATGYYSMRLEGFTSENPNRVFGGTNPNDNSGELTYVRVEFGGVALDPTQLNSEINAFTFGAVGNGTTMHHLQACFSGDDSFEWFGGTVNARYLVAYRGIDDDFDTDNGYNGNVQFGLGIKDPNIADDSQPSYESNGFESDNNGVSPYNGKTYSGQILHTNATFSNMTLIGPWAGGNAYGLNTVNGHHASAAHLRRNTAQYVRNSIFVGYNRGLRFQTASTKDNLTATSGDSTSAFKTNVLSGSFPNYLTTNSFSTTPTVGTDVNTAWVLQTADGFTRSFYAGYATANQIDTLTTASQINFVNSNFSSTSGLDNSSGVALVPDFRLNASSNVSTGADFTNLCSGVSITTSTVAPICANQTLNLQSNALGTAPITYTWTGLGTIASANSASTSVTGASGNYTLYATNACGTSSSVVNVTVNALPTVTLGTFTPLCISNSSFTLTSGLPSGGTYSGNGVTAGVFNPTSAGVGTHTITYSYTNGNGCSNSASKNITVNALPNVTLGTFSPVCLSNANITLTSGLPTGGSYSGNGVASGVFSPANAGVGAQTITYSFTDGNGCSNSASNNITVNALPNISIISSTICAGATGTVSASGAATYTWNTGATTNSIIDNPSTTTVYTVSGTSAAGCLGSSVSATITVGAAPSIVVNSASVCAGSSATLTANGVTTYTWNTGDNSASIIVTPTVNTVYNVSGNLIGCGVSASNTATVTINTLPVISVNSGAICLGQSFTITPSGATTYTYSSGSNIVSPSAIQSYTVTGTNVNGCVSASGAISTVSVNALPNVSIGTFSAVCLANASFTLNNGLPSGGSYSGNGVATGVFSPASAGVGTHTITYSYTDGNGCSNTASNNILVNTCTGINNVEVQNELVTMYPNPTSNQTSLIVNSNIVSKINVFIYDYTGKLVLNPINENVIEGNNEFKINTENLSNGIYLVSIITNSLKETKKLVINK